jgi:hypothetical protein
MIPALIFAFVLRASGGLVAFGPVSFPSGMVSDLVMWLTVGIGVLRLADSALLAQVAESRRKVDATADRKEFHLEDGPTRLQRMARQAGVESRVKRPYMSTKPRRLHNRPVRSVA